MYGTQCNNEDIEIVLCGTNNQKNCKKCVCAEYCVGDDCALDMAH